MPSRRAARRALHPRAIRAGNQADRTAISSILAKSGWGNKLWSCCREKGDCSDQWVTSAENRRPPVTSPQRFAETPAGRGGHHLFLSPKIIVKIPVKYDVITIPSRM